MHSDIAKLPALSSRHQHEVDRYNIGIKQVSAIPDDQREILDNSKQTAFERIMGDPTMPDDAGPNYDNWLFEKVWNAAKSSARELSADDLIDRFKEHVRGI